MKRSLIFTLLLFMIIVSCQNSEKEIKHEVNINQTKNVDSLFKLDIRIAENFVKIDLAKSVEFYLLDSTVRAEPYKFGDFNNDGKEDIMVYLGACGTGGCMYGLFLNQFDNYYKLAYLDYLKGAEFVEDTNGFWFIKSYEEVEPYNPSRLYVTIFKFDQNKYSYELDTTYIYQNDDSE